MHVKLHKQITAAHSRGRMAAGRHNEIQFYFDTSLTTRHTTWLTLCGGLTLTQNSATSYGSCGICGSVKISGDLVMRSPGHRHRRFGGTWCLHILSWRNRIYIEMLVPIYEVQSSTSHKLQVRTLTYHRRKLPKLSFGGVRLLSSNRPNSTNVTRLYIHTHTHTHMHTYTHTYIHTYTG